MSRMGVVLCRDFNEIRDSNAFRILVIVCTIVTVGMAAGISFALSGADWLRVAATRPILELVTGLVAYFLPFAILMSFIWVFASLPITKEKLNGNIECLLATPLSPVALWMGKCLAIFLPGFVISVISTVLVLLTVNLTAIVPAIGHFVLPLPVLVTGFFSNPLLFFGLLCFIVLFSLANNPDIAIAPSFLVGFGLMIGIPLGMATGFINLASWPFALWYLAGTVIVWAVVLYLSRLLNRENIILSSKGA